MTKFQAALGYLTHRDPLAKSLYSDNSRPWHEEFRYTPFHAKALQCHREHLEAAEEAKKEQASLRAEYEKKRNAMARDLDYSKTYEPIEKVNAAFHKKKSDLMIAKLKWEEEKAKEESSMKKSIQPNTLEALSARMTDWKP